MRQSKLLTKTLSSPPSGEEAINAKLLTRAGYIDKLMAGSYTLLPLGLRVFRNIEKIVREEMEAVGGQEILMPALHPKASWEATGRYEAMDVLFKLTSKSSSSQYVLGSTHEEIITPLMVPYAMSYKDLPFYAFQIQNKFRDEKRAKSGLLRLREFSMKDLYSFHKNEEDLDAYYEKVSAAYQRIFSRVGLGDKTYLTYASGGSFSKYSHEFQTITEYGEDIIYLCADCKVAVNKEIYGEQNVCPKCNSAKLEEKKAIEVGNIFKLKTKFSDAFGLKYSDEQGKENPVVMGCYGLGLQRVMGTVVEACHDENGIIWPESIAPYRVHLLELPGADASSVYKKLNSSGVEVLYDDRSISAGAKFSDADLLGIPWRFVVSVKTAGGVEVKRRDSSEVEVLDIEAAIKKISG